MSEFEASIKALVSEAVRAELAKLSDAERAEAYRAHSRHSFRERLPKLEDPERGLVYAVLLIPEMYPHRIKVGFTAGRMMARLSRFRTTCPTAVMLGAWDANFSDEQTVLLHLPGRVGSSEVFVVEHIDKFLDKIERRIAECKRDEIEEATCDA